MRFLCIVVSTIIIFHVSKGQDPPPVFDLPPPIHVPSIDSSPPDINVADPTATGGVEIVANISVNDTVGENNETVITNATVGTNRSDSSVRENDTLTDTLILFTNETSSPNITSLTMVDTKDNATADNSSVLRTISNKTQSSDTQSIFSEQSASSNDTNADTLIMIDSINETGDILISFNDTEGGNVTSANDTEGNILVVTGKSENFSIDATTNNTTLERATLSDSILSSLDSVLQSAIDLPPPPPPPPMIPKILPEILLPDTFVDLSITVDANQTIGEGNVLLSNETDSTINITTVSTKEGKGLKKQPTIDLLPPPIPESPSVTMEEKPGATTIEISTILEVVDRTKPISEYPPETTDALYITTTEMTTEATRIFVKPVVSNVTGVKPETTTVLDSKVDEPKTRQPPVVRLPAVKTAALPPDHPPPIFFGNRRPPVYTEQIEPVPNYVLTGETTKRPGTTTEQPPPPIFISPPKPTRTSVQDVSVHSLELHRPLEQNRPVLLDNDPRYMNTLELAAFTLQNIRLKSQKEERNSFGVQTFFPTTPKTNPTTTTEMTTTTSPTTTTYKPNREIPAFLKLLYAQQGFQQVPTPIPTTPKPTTPKPVVKPVEKAPPEPETVYDTQYFMDKYVLNVQTTVNPTLQTTSSTRRKVNTVTQRMVKHTTPITSIPVSKPNFNKPSNMPEPSISSNSITSTEVPNTFFDANYLLSMINSQSGLSEPLKRLPQDPPRDNIQQQLPQTSHQNQHQSTTEVKPITNVIESIKPWLGDMSIKQGAVNQITKESPSGPSVMKNQNPAQVETRPITWNTNIDAQSLINYNSNDPVGQGDLTSKLDTTVPSIRIQPSSSSRDSMSHWTMVNNGSFRPRDHIYGTSQHSVLPNDPSHDLKERFNRKWFHSDTTGQNEVVNSVPNVHATQVQQLPNIEISTNAPEKTTKNTNVRSLFDLIFNVHPRQPRQHSEPSQYQQSQQQFLLQQQLTIQRQQQELMEEQRRIEELQKLLNMKRQAEQQQVLEQQQQREMQKLRQQQLLMQQRQLPLASQISQSEVRPALQSGPRTHTFTPQVSSIQIYQAPAFRTRQHRLETRRTKQDHENPIGTLWKARLEHKNIHGHLAVPYNLNNQANVTKLTTQAAALSQSQFPLSSISNTKYPTTQSTIRFTTEPPTPIPITTRLTTTSRPTVPPTADPNPPPIFDTKVQMMFMPMPIIDHVTQPPKTNTSAATGWNDADNNPNYDSRCKGCVFVNDRCLLPDPVHCNEYIECVRQSSFVRSFNRECALGSFFNRKSFICVDPKNADCATDRCREPGTKWYGVHNRCKHYWSCVLREGGGAYAQSECCPDMGGFVDGVGCVEDKNCTDSCSSTIQTAEPTVSSCLPYMALNFTGNTIVDSSNTKQHIGVEGVSTTLEGEALFNGAGRLVIWRYANLMFPLVFAMRFRFLSTTAEPRFQTIFSNCDKNSATRSTFEISLDTHYREVIFKIDTYEGPAKKFKIMYTHNKWTDVDVIYDGERLVGAVNRRARNIFAGGGIETRPQPIGIGACGGNGGLKGLLDDVFIYEECIPDELYGVFMSVLE